ncbi:glycosyltransferase [Hymenobacter busanensis]|uniref:Glycosyltransferase n=1 Tax=Hymenobacter busanensis TaxID=2607656 RepID=A0A7L4ZVW1_9BACT|nr:glycosyltransferase [Hymenobacter busanensis]KAA9339252.1 glycosyltransferase [Hymenobacter busanensis]QHJ06986.1 glycosyltransferase [Hymenobacter busanensis]
MPASEPSVLLSIVTWNSAETIAACLQSALAQTHPNITVWVVDNASTDDTCARVAAIAATDARLHLHRLPQNTGFCGGHNYALDRTHTDAVLLVNPDVVLPPDYLATALAVLHSDERIGTVCGVLLQSTGTDPTIDSAGLVALPDSRFRLRYHGQPLSSVALAAEVEDVDGADGALPLYRRRFIDDLRVEGAFFDERFFAHKEDWDISWRSRLYGWRTVLATQCRALHPRHFLPADVRLRLRLSGAMKADAVKNQLLLLLKNPTSAQLPGQWLRAFPRQFAILLFVLLLERRSLQAYAYIKRNWRHVWASRRQVQARAARGWAPPAVAGGAPQHPLLSICVPCYHRPELLARALRSIGPLPPDVEIVVSDNSTRNNLCEYITRYVLSSQPANQWRYFHNPPGSTAATNFNDCLRRARGHYVLHLHDDDFLRPGGLAEMLQTLRRVRHTHATVLFGVELVDMQRRTLRKQTTAREQYLPPLPALERVLTDSSLVRIPAIVVSRAAYQAAGCIDHEQGSTGDTDLWARIFAMHGVLCVPGCPAAYTVHDGAITAAMFNADTIGKLLRIFGKIEQAALLPAPRLRRAKDRFLHQFVLAGTYRSLQARNLEAAREVYALFELPELRRLRIPARWLPVRLAFGAVIQAGQWWATNPFGLRPPEKESELLSKNYQ